MVRDGRPAMKTLQLLLLLAAPLAAQGTAAPFGTGCPDPGPRALGFSPSPGAGRLALYELGAAPGAVPLACLGFSATQWGTQALPLPLDAFGLPGCSILAEPASVAWTALPADGVA